MGRTSARTPPPTGTRWRRGRRATARTRTRRRRDKSDGLAPATQLFDDLHAVLARHEDVEDDQRGRMGTKELDTFFAGRRRDDVMARAAQDDGHELPSRRVVVDHEDPRHGVMKVSRSD